MTGVGGLLAGWEGSPVALAIGVLLGVFAGWLAGRWYASTYAGPSERPRAPAAEPLSQLARAHHPSDLVPVLRAARTELADEAPGSAGARLDRRLARLERRARGNAPFAWSSALWMSPSERFTRFAGQVDRALAELDRRRGADRP